MIQIERALRLVYGDNTVDRFHDLDELDDESTCADEGYDENSDE